MGLYGIILSTIISVMFISIPWIVNNVFTLIFKTDAKSYFMELILYTIGVFFIGTSCWALSMVISGNNIMLLLLKGVATFAIANILFYLLFRKSRYFANAKNILFRLTYLDKIVRGK